MTWAESDELTWDERQVLLAMVDRRLADAAPAPAQAGHVPAAERLVRGV